MPSLTEHDESPPRKTGKVQKALDFMYKARMFLAAGITYLAIRIYGVEITWKSVLEEGFESIERFDLDLQEAEDLDLILHEARSCFLAAKERKAAVSEKCKTLLTLSSFLLAAMGIVTSRVSLDGAFENSLFIVCAALLLISIVLLAIFFGVRREMEISIDEEDVKLGARDLRVRLIENYLQCQKDTDGRVDFLADIYKSARLFFLLSLMGFFVLFCKTSGTMFEKKISEKRVAEGLIGNAEFIEKICHQMETRDGSRCPSGRDRDESSKTHLKE